MFGHKGMTEFMEGFQKDNHQAVSDQPFEAEKIRERRYKALKALTQKVKTDKGKEQINEYGRSGTKSLTQARVRVRKSSG